MEDNVLTADLTAKPVVAHIAFGGLGGLPMCCLNLATQGLQNSRQIIAWYGNEPLAAQYRDVCESNNIPYKVFFKKPGLDLGTQLEIGKWIKQYDPECMVCHTPASLFCGLVLRGFKNRIFVLGIEHHSNALKRLKEWTLSLIAPFVADHMIYLSDEYQRQVDKKYPFLKLKSNRTVVPNGIDLDKFPYPAERKPGVIGMQGRMVPGKDYETLVNAFAKLDGNSRLVLIGDGPDRPRLEQLCAELGISDRVEFKGVMKNSELIKQMCMWQIFVLSTDGETMSMSIMEAQALGLAIVGSRVSGVTSAIKHNEDGLLFTPRNVDSLVSVLHSLLNDPEKRETLGVASRRYAVENHSIATTWDTYAQIMGIRK